MSAVINAESETGNEFGPFLGEFHNFDHKTIRINFPSQRFPIQIQLVKSALKTTFEQQSERLHRNSNRRIGSRRSEVTVELRCNGFRVTHAILTCEVCYGNNFS